MHIANFPKLEKVRNVSTSEFGQRTLSEAKTRKGKHIDTLTQC